MKIFYVIVVLICLSAMYEQVLGQGHELKSYFDDQKSMVKELYTLKSVGSKILHGPYTSFFKNGNLKTQGQYFNNVSNGAWEFYYEDGGLRRRGSLKDGKNEGMWEYFYENRQKSMEGDISGGARQGYWKMYYSTGMLKSEGAFKDGKKQDRWKYYYDTGGLLAVANYEVGQGMYEEYYPTGNVKMSGEKVSGQKNGIWTYFYEDGTKKAVGYFFNGLKNGNWKYYNEQGNLISEGIYIKDQPGGLWLDYHENGEVSSRGIYEKGQKHGYWELFYKDGTSRGIGDFVNGTGAYREFYKSGSLRLKGALLNGKNHGHWDYYYENGKLEGVCEFDNGVGEYLGYYSDKKLKMKGTIRNNERIGIWELYKEDGTIAGYYKPYYENGNPTLWLAKDSKQQKALNRDRGRKAGTYKFKMKKFNHFDSKINEFRALIIGYNPIAPVFGSFPLVLEYYFQERLGYELLFILIRDPFFRKHKSLSFGENYEQGWELALRQKFYKSVKITGSPYFGHEIRYSNINHLVKIPDQDIPDNNIVLEQLENKYEYSLFVGNRYFKSPNEGGMTIDLYIGLGIGYRSFTRDFNSTEDNVGYFSDLPTSNMSLAFRLGVNLGIAMRIRK